MNRPKRDFCLRLCDVVLFISTAPLEHQVVYQVKDKVLTESFLREIQPQLFEGLTRWRLFILRPDEQEASLRAAALAG